MSKVLRRTYDLGNVDLNRVVDEIHAKVNSMNGMESPAPSRSSAGGLSTSTIAPSLPTTAPPALTRIVNSGTANLQIGEIVGISSSGVPAKATGVSTGAIRPALVMLFPCAPNQEIRAIAAGYAAVLVQSSIFPSIGDPCWLSVSEPGRATNVKPSNPNKSFLLGSFLSRKDATTGMSLINFIPNMQASTGV